MEGTYSDGIPKLSQLTSPSWCLALLVRGPDPADPLPSPVTEPPPADLWMEGCDPFSVRKRNLTSRRDPASRAQCYMVRQFGVLARPARTGVENTPRSNWMAQERRLLWHPLTASEEVSDRIGYLATGYRVRDETRNLKVEGIGHRVDMVEGSYASLAGMEAQRDTS